MVDSVYSYVASGTISGDKSYESSFRNLSRLGARSGKGSLVREDGSLPDSFATEGGSGANPSGFVTTQASGNLFANASGIMNDQETEKSALARKAYEAVSKGYQVKGQRPGQSVNIVI
jgi:hypothetical protein